MAVFSHPTGKAGPYFQILPKEMTAKPFRELRGNAVETLKNLVASFFGVPLLWGYGLVKEPSPAGRGEHLFKVERGR